MSVSHETLTPLETRLPNNSGIHGNTCSLTYCKAPAGIMGVSPLLPVSKLALSELSLPNSRLALSSAHSLWRLQRGKLYFTSSLRARLIKHNLSEEPYSQKSSPFPFRHRRVKKRKKKRPTFSMASWPERIAGCWALVEKCSIEKCKWEWNLSENLDPTGDYWHLEVWPSFLLKYVALKWAKSEVIFQKSPAFISSYSQVALKILVVLMSGIYAQTRKKRKGHISVVWVLRFPLDTVLITDSLGNSPIICIVFPC